jgi:hypothetical protein
MVILDVRRRREWGQAGGDTGRRMEGKEGGGGWSARCFAPRCDLSRWATQTRAVRAIEPMASESAVVMCAVPRASYLKTLCVTARLCWHGNKVSQCHTLDSSP